MGPIGEREFEAVFEEHGAAVLSYLLRRADRVTAEDVLSETFLVAWRRRSELVGEPLPWLYGIARRALANEVRGDRRRSALWQRMVHEPTAGVSAEPPWCDATLAALAALAEGDREVLLLDAWEELSREEAAVVLGCRPATYGVRLHRARRRFRRAFAAAASQEVQLPEASESHA